MNDNAQIRIEELKRRINRAEDRMTRTTTIDDYLADMQIVQESNAEIEHLKAKQGQRT